MSSPDVHPELSWQQKLLVLTAAFLGWMFAGLQIALFVLIHRPAMISLMTDGAAANAPAVNEREETSRNLSRNIKEKHQGQALCAPW